MQIPHTVSLVKVIYSRHSQTTVINVQQAAMFVMEKVFLAQFAVMDTSSQLIYLDFVFQMVLALSCQDLLYSALFPISSYKPKKKTL